MSGKKKIDDNIIANVRGTQSSSEKYLHNALCVCIHVKTLKLVNTNTVIFVKTKEGEYSENSSPISKYNEIKKDKNPKKTSSNKTACGKIKALGKTPSKFILSLVKFFPNPRKTAPESRIAFRMM